MQVNKLESNVVIVGNLKGGSVFRPLDSNQILMVIKDEEEKYVDLEDGMYHQIDSLSSVEYFPQASVELKS